jgi:hypothetical protein
MRVLPGTVADEQDQAGAGGLGVAALSCGRNRGHLVRRVRRGKTYLAPKEKSAATAAAEAAFQRLLQRALLPFLKPLPALIRI